MIQLTKETVPTLDDVQTRLESGEIKLSAANYAVSDLAQQLFDIQPAVLRFQDMFEAAGYADTNKRLIEAHRLVELGGYAEADVKKNRVDVRTETLRQKTIRKRLVANRDAVVRLARDAGVNWRLYSVNFGSGNAGRIVTPAQVFKAVLEEHGAALKSDFLIKQILEETRNDVTELLDAELAQEKGKKDGLIPANLRMKARHALYAHLLHFSRVGFALLRKDTENRDLFSLRVLRSSSKNVRPVVDDDDAPVLYNAPNAGIPVPPGNVVALGADAAPA